MKVFSSDALGLHDPGREARYRNFVEDLHRRLGAAERANIRFIAGLGTGRYWFLLAMISLLSLSMMGGIGLALLLGRLGIHITLLAIAVAAMTAAFVRMLQVNAPHAYDPANPLEGAAQGSIGDTIAHAFGEIHRIFGARLLLLLAVGGLVIVAIAVFAVGARQSVTLFEPGRARHAFEIIHAASPWRRITKVKVTADTVMVRFLPLGSSSAPIEMSASRARLPGWGEWDRLFGPYLNYDVPVGDDWGGFEARADDLAKLADLVRAAIAEAGLGDGSEVSEMVLNVAPDYTVSCMGVGTFPHWTVQVTNGRRNVTIFGDRRGDLLAGNCTRRDEDQR